MAMTSRSNFQLSIDPSIASSGLCLWRRGKVIKWKTIKTPPRLNLVTRVKALLDELQAFIGGRSLSEIVIEEFQGHRKNGMLNMMKCCVAQGALIAASLRLARNVTLINKRNEPKEVAQQCARDFGLPNLKSDEADAFRLGQLAGFDRDEKR